MDPRLRRGHRGPGRCRHLPAAGRRRPGGRQRRSASSSAARAANVAVAAARHGLRAALVSRTGDDPFGRFVHAALRELGVDDRYVTAVADLPTPVTFCEIFPPDDFPLYFYRRPAAPDMQLTPAELPTARGPRPRGVFWTTGIGAVARSRAGRRTHAACAARGRAAADRARPGLPADVLARPGEPRPRQLEPALEHVTVAVGNLDECDTAVGERDPHRAAAALLDRGLELAVVKQGPQGVLAGDPGRAWSRCRRSRSRWSTGSAPATRSAARCATGLLAGWPLERDDPVRQRGRRDRRRPGWSAPPPCRPPPRCEALLTRGRQWPTAGGAASARPPDDRRRDAAAADRSAARAPAGRGCRSAAATAAVPRRRRAPAPPLLPARRPAAARRRRPPGPRRARRARRARSRWPTGPSCWSGWWWRCPGPAWTACSAPPTCWRTCCCSARWRARWSSAR